MENISYQRVFLHVYGKCWLSYYVMIRNPTSITYCGVLFSLSYGVRTRFIFVNADKQLQTQYLPFLVSVLQVDGDQPILWANTCHDEYSFTENTHKGFGLHFIPDILPWSNINWGLTSLPYIFKINQHIQKRAHLLSRNTQRYQKF